MSTTVWVVISAWWVLLAVIALAICHAAGRADEITAQWEAERSRARDALEGMGADADEMWSS